MIKLVQIKNPAAESCPVSHCFVLPNVYQRQVSQVTLDCFGEELCPWQRWGPCLCLAEWRSELIVRWFLFIGNTNIVNDHILVSREQIFVFLSFSCLQGRDTSRSVICSISLTDVCYCGGQHFKTRKTAAMNTEIHVEKPILCSCIAWAYPIAVGASYVWLLSVYNDTWMNEF